MPTRKRPSRRTAPLLLTFDMKTPSSFGSSGLPRCPLSPPLICMPSRSPSFLIIVTTCNQSDISYAFVITARLININEQHQHRIQLIIKITSISDKRFVYLNRNRFKHTTLFDSQLDFKNLREVSLYKRVWRKEERERAEIILIFHAEVP